MLSRYADAITEAPRLRWIGYLSTTGVYGDRKGGWVDEGTEPAPVSDRSSRRLAAEQAWGRLADRRAVDVFRLAGIYGRHAQCSTICAPGPRGVSAGLVIPSGASIATTSCPP